MKKHLLFTIALISIFISCEDKPATEQEIIGTWYMPQVLNRITSGRSADEVGGHSLNAWNYTTMITTNSNQDLVDQIADAEGSIALKGHINENLNYMNGWADEDNRASVSVTNYNWNTSNGGGLLQEKNPIVGINLNYFPEASMLDLHSDSGMFSSNDDYFGVYYNDGTYYEATMPLEINFSYDGKLLTIPAQTFNIHSQSDTTVNHSVSLEGKLAHATKFIPANTPTKIMDYQEDMSWDYGSWSIHIEEGGRWVEVYTWEDPYDSSGWSHTYTDSTIAKWELKEDQIIVTYRYDDIWIDAGSGPSLGQGAWLYEVAYNYKLKDSGTLKLINENDMCSALEMSFFDAGPSDGYCLKMFENQFGLDEGSLEEIKMIWELEFSKLPPTRKLKKLKTPLQRHISKLPPYSFMKK